MKKRFLAMLLALALCVGLMPAAAAANNDFVIDEDGVLQGYNGPGGDVKIPDGVTGIGDQAFYECSGSVTSVTIPSGVTKIGDWAFGDCTSLTSVTIPSSVTSIGGYAFHGTPWLQKLGDLPIVNGIVLEYQGDSSSVTIPSNVTSIAASAFYERTGLTSVTIPSSVTSIGASAFYGTPWQESLGDFPVVNGILLRYQGQSSSVTIPSNVTSIADRAFVYCRGLTSVTIPSNVTNMGEAAFANCYDLTSVTIQDGVPSIGEQAFYYCTSLTSVTIPNSVTKIGAWAFCDCESLTSVTIPSSVTSIGTGVFENCNSMTSVTIPNSVTEIGDHAFYSCYGLTSMTIPNSVTRIGEMAFAACTELTSITIPSSVTSIERDAFNACTSLTDVYYGGSVAQWKAIDIGPYNDLLINAGLQCNSPMPTVSFTDVDPNEYYADPVSWAIEKGITNGTSASTFSPNNTCTHGQILTFLWRAAGEPESSAVPPFAVSEKDYFYGAVKWACEKGMIGAGFKDKTPCTRADAVRYIWYAFDKPAGGSNGFTDVPAGTEYAQAVAWAVSKGITNGTSPTTFSPNDICKRGQIVTFLHRAYVG